MKRALNHFKKVDKKLFDAAKSIALEPLKPRKPRDYFKSICREIIGQQLAGKVARVIFERFTELFPGKKITAQRILEFPEQKLRDVGMAWSKVRAIKDLAQKTEDKTLQFRKMESMTNGQVVEMLTKVKGIGPWTADMFLMFTLGREDVFSDKDLGLRKAIIKLYGLDEKVTDKELNEISMKWSPYRTYACLTLWKLKDGD
ncbi:MAG: DNA-3-methyladenine glycosylase 2 family protein [Candidatus Nanoarchaeia archaeon]|nr:DNA-3-methyladenine glycosylase 2 family protein [Candidatus Nanoarchaeia archaeon]MDD5239567.1 DNA-3-methyladenine glycosylase 2 family protein [Candidatus Nanoarchaeia archaeon]